MLYDLNLNTGHPPSFRKGIPKDRWLEFAVFALTPGIPHEYVQYLVGIRNTWVQKASYKIVDDLRDIAEPLALENAASITVQDGYNMIYRIRARPRKTRYVGRKPHWASIALIQLCRERGWATIGKELRAPERSLNRWRKSCFHPLTLQPLRPFGGLKKVRPYQRY